MLKKPVADGNRSHNNGSGLTLVTLCIVVAALYFARVVFIPFALAVLLAFLLAPLVVRLRHWGPGPRALRLHCRAVLYNFVEPLLYGSTTGISPMGILVATVFWTWLWGPVGLLLATPLAVCVVVVGRYVPNLEFLSILLSDEPVLTPETRFYQRMLAMDLDEATEVSEQFLKGKSLEDLGDAVIIPALSLAEEERHRGTLDADRQRFIFQNTRLLVEDLAERAEELVAGNNSTRNRNGSKTNGEPKNGGPKNGAPEGQATVLCIPARDEADEIAALMLAQLLTKRGVGAKVLSSTALAGEAVEEVGRDGTKIACVVMVPPYGYLHARYLCRRLRAQFADLKLVAAILTERGVEEVKKRQPPIPADELGSSLKQALAAILSLLPAANHDSKAVAPVPATVGRQHQKVNRGSESAAL